jgi:hypothetical protein
MSLDPSNFVVAEIAGSGLRICHCCSPLLSVERLARPTQAQATG